MLFSAAGDGEAWGWDLTKGVAVTKFLGAPRQPEPAGRRAARRERPNPQRRL